MYHQHVAGCQKQLLCKRINNMPTVFGVNLVPLCRIPKTVDASHKEWAELKGQWAKRSDLHLAEVGRKLPSIPTSVV